MTALLNRLGLAALICAAFISTIYAAPDRTPPKEAEEEEEEPVDEALSDMMLKMYSDGTMKAMYAVALHAEPKEGQLWKTRSVTDFGGIEQKTSDQWQVAKVIGKQAVIENRQSTYGLVLAYLVDTSLTEEELWKKGNVRKAWVGKKGEAPIEIEVMEIPKAEGGEDAQPPEKNYTDTSEEFKDLELAGKKWSGKKATLKMNDNSFESSSWVADKGWFNKVVKMAYKMEAGTMTQELAKVSSTAKPLLKWDGIKFEEEKKEEKEPEKKEGSK